MRIGKFIGIWLTGLMIIFLLINFAGGLFLNKTAAERLESALKGYAAKMNLPPEPAANEQEEKNIGGMLLVRSAICDAQFVNEKPPLYSLLFANCVCDESIIFLNQDGLHPFSKGIFSEAYHSIDTKMDHIYHPVGLIDIRKLSQHEAAGDLQTVLADHPDAVVRLDAYTISDYAVEPVQISLLDEADQPLITREFPAEGDVIREDNCLIQSTVFNGKSDFYEKIALAQQGERKCDRMAADLVDSVPLAQDGYESGKMRCGIMKITRTYTEVSGSNAMIAVHIIDYHQSALFCLMVYGTLFSAVLTVIFLFSRKHN